MEALLATPAVGAMVVLGSGRLYTRPAFGAALVLILYLMNAVVVSPLSGELAGFTLYPEDVVFSGVFAVAVLRLTVGGYLLARHWPWLLFGAATMVSFTMGSQLYGLKPAGVEYRSVFYVVAGCLYSASFRVDSEEAGRLVRLWLWSAALLVVLAWLRWAAEFLQLGVRSQWAGVGGDNPMRVLNAGQAFFLSQAFVTTVYLLRHVTARAVLSCYAGLLLVTVILLQHRSVWVVTAACCLMLAWRERALRKLLGVVALALVLGAPSYFLVNRYADTVGESLRSSVAEPFDSRRSTIAWRAVLWEQHFIEFVALSGAQTWFGVGFGNPTIYSVEGGAVSHAAHNYFVFALNRMGILGLVSLVLAYGLLLRRLRGWPGSWDYLGLFVTMIGGQLVYFLVYSPSFEQGLISGTALGLAAVRVPGRSAE
jgi:O-antigen ligase